MGFVGEIKYIYRGWGQRKTERGSKSTNCWLQCQRSSQVTSFENALPLFFFVTYSLPAFSQLLHEGKWHFEMKNNLCHKQHSPLSLRGFCSLRKQNGKQPSHRAGALAYISMTHLGGTFQWNGHLPCVHFAKNVPHVELLSYQKHFFFLLHSSKCL